MISNVMLFRLLRSDTVLPNIATEQTETGAVKANTSNATLHTESKQSEETYLALAVVLLLKHVQY